jgi:hypothetical protein
MLAQEASAKVVQPTMEMRAIQLFMDSSVEKADSRGILPRSREW